MAITITQTIDSGSDLRRAFEEIGRRNSFSDSGFDALYDYLENCGDIELDVIALDCDFSEDSLENVLKNYDLESFDELNDNTYAVMVDDENVLYINY